MQASAFRTCTYRAGVFTGSRVAVAPQRAQLLAPTISRRGAVQVVAAEATEQNKKRTPQPEKRAQIALDRRSRNRSRKSAIATRTKKVRSIRGSARLSFVTFSFSTFCSMSNCCHISEWAQACACSHSSNHKSSSSAAHWNWALGDASRCTEGHLPVSSSLVNGLYV